MYRCDVCKHKDKCVGIPFGCECFGVDDPHDSKIINKFAEELKSRLGDAIHPKDFESMKNLIDDVARQMKEQKIMSEFCIPKEVDVLKIDLSEYEAKVRAEERAEIQSELMTEVAMLNETKMTMGDLKCFAYRIKAIAEQIKEPKND